MTFLDRRGKLCTRVIPMSGVALVTILVLSCDDSPLPTDLGEMPFRIADAAHSGHNLDFFFLPPLVPDPSGHLAFEADSFDAGQSPEVRICALDGDECTATPEEGFPITYTMTEGPGSEVVRVSEPDQHYIVNWHTNEWVLESGVTYRITVLVAGIELGFADVDVVGSNQEFKSVQTDEFIALKDGRTLPIKFRLEHGAMYWYPVDAAGGTISAVDGAVILDVPADAVSDSMGLAVRPASDYPSDSTLVPGTAFDFGPDGLTFAEPVLLTIAYDEPLREGMDESSLRIHKLVGETWEVVPDGTLDPEANTVSAPISGFSTYVIAERPLDAISSDLHILFGSTRLGDFDVFSVALGSDPTPLLVHGGTRDGHPVPSPNGEWLAFVRDRDGDLDVYVANVGNWVVRKLTDNDVDERNPDWSPDGSRIVFESKQGGDWDICVIDADRSGFTNLTSNDAIADREPDWSPDGGRIAFASNRDGNRELYVLNLNDGVVERITSTDYSERDPDWSPDGLRLAYGAFQHGDWHIFKYSLLGDYSTLLTHPYFGGGYEPAWSPNGDHITFVSARDGGNWDIYVMNADGTGQTRLTDDPGLDARPAWGVLGEGQFMSTWALVNDPFFTGLIPRLQSSTAENVDAAFVQATGAMIGNDTDGLQTSLATARDAVADGDETTTVERAFLEVMLNYVLSLLN